MQVFSTLYFIALFFPYVGYFPVSVDTQPYALILGVSYLVIKSFAGLKLHKFAIYLLIPIGASIILLFNYYSINALRSIAGFVSVFVFAVSIYDILKHPKYNNLFFKIFKLSVTIWLIGGVIEYIYEPGIWAPMLNDMRFGGSGRGLNSFAPEPTYWGMHCIFLLVLNELTIKYKSVRYLLILQIVFFAMSSMAAAFLILYLLIKLLEKISITKLLQYTASVWGVIFIIKLYFSETRLGILFDYLVDSPDKLINIDVSINSRVGHLIFSLLGAWDSWFEPQGFNKFADYLDSKLLKVSWYEWLGGYDSDMRIMSGLGGAIYELGIFGLFYVIITFVSAASNKIQKPSMILYSIYIILIMLTAQPLTYPLFGVTLGMLMLKIPEKYNATNLSRSCSLQYSDRKAGINIQNKIF